MARKSKEEKLKSEFLKIHEKMEKDRVLDTKKRILEKRSKEA